MHTKEDTYLFEILDSLLKREMLMVTRIAKTASGIGFGGGKTNTQVLRWEKKNKQLSVKKIENWLKFSRKMNQWRCCTKNFKRALTS